MGDRAGSKKEWETLGAQGPKLIDGRRGAECFVEDEACQQADGTDGGASNSSGNVRQSLRKRKGKEEW